MNISVFEYMNVWIYEYMNIWKIVSMVNFNWLIIKLFLQNETNWTSKQLKPQQAETVGKRIKVLKKKKRTQNSAP